MQKRTGTGDSPYQQLRKNRQIKVDIHSSSATSNSSVSPLSPVSPASIINPPATNTSHSNSRDHSSSSRSTDSSSTSSSSGASFLPSIPSIPTSEKRKNVWIKPKNNAVNIPPEVLELLVQDIERRHAGQLQAEEIVWYQGSRPFREAIKTSWATGLSLMLFLTSIFVCVGIVFYVPDYLKGTALLPPIVSIILIVLLIKRIRVDLYGCYALTRTRAIIIVPKKQLGVLKPLILNFDFLLEKNLIMLQYQEARLQDTILSREPALTDLVHNPHGVGTVSFYPRTKLSIPFRFYNVQNSHAFELDFTDTMNHTPTPVGGGRLRIEKPSFEEQRSAARRYKIFPILGILWGILIVGLISGILWGVWYTRVTDHVTIAMVVLAWVFASTLSVASVYPLYSLARGKREAKANNRYVKYIIDK